MCCVLSYSNEESCGYGGMYKKWLALAFDAQSVLAAAIMLVSYRTLALKPVLPLEAMHVQITVPHRRHRHGAPAF